MKYRYILCILGLFLILSALSCASMPKQTVELAEISQEQIAELQKSHIRIVQLYYDGLRSDINDFIDNKWIPLFLSKAVENEQFRKDLDEAYATINIKPFDVEVKWQGQQLSEPQKSIVLSGIEKAITDEKSKFAEVLKGFTEATQKEINKKRKELLAPIDEQEKLIIREINAAYADLYSAQATLKGYLSSAVEVRENQELLFKKLGVLEKSQDIMNKTLNANDKLSGILNDEGITLDKIKEYLENLNKKGLSKFEIDLPD